MRYPGGGWLQRPVPSRATRAPYLLGGMSVAVFLMLVVSGLYLAFFYKPLPQEANQSVRYLIEQAPLGRWIRSVHFWAATFFVVLVALHLIRVWIWAAYRRPRQKNWLVGIGLLGLTGLSLYSGTVLKWDQQGYDALRKGREVAEGLGGWGPWLGDMLSAGEQTLTRLSAMHFVLVPVALTALLVLHLLLVRSQGVSSPPWAVGGEAGTRGRSTAGDITLASYLRRLGVWSLGTMAVTLVLAVLLSPGLGPPPAPTVAMTKPPWYFLWLYPLEQTYGPKALLIGPLVLMLLLIVLPAADLGRVSGRRRPALAAAVILVLLFAGWVNLTLWGGLSGLGHVD
jgi:ubiquinol-cytochrome c reductase cytochrome b subunit